LTPRLSRTSKIQDRHRHESESEDGKALLRAPIRRDPALVARWVTTKIESRGMRGVKPLALQVAKSA
jgi:hypothetical protein